MRRVVDLVFTLPSHPAWVEPVLMDGADEGAIARDAVRDGLGSALGRTLLGVVLTEEGAQDPRRLLPSRPDQPPPLTLRADEVSPSPEPARRPGPPLPSPPTPYYEIEGALGFTGRFGLALDRCLALDPEVALEAAQLVCSHLSRQGELFPVAAPALPALLSLLDRRDLAGRALLAEALASLGVCHGSPQGPLEAAAGQALRRLRGVVLGPFAEDQRRPARRRRAAEAATRDAVAAHRDAVAALTQDPEVGWAAARALGPLT